MEKLKSIKNFIIRNILNPEYNKSTKLCYIFFALVICFYIFYMLIMQYDWLTSGEMWAETAVNYYSTSTSNDFLKMLFAIDAGYWTFLLRILAYIPVLLKIPINIIPFYYNWLGIIIIPLLIAPFCLPEFRKVIKSDIFRFIICICFLLTTDFTTSIFISFLSYSVFFISIIIILAILEGKDGKVPNWAWFIPILIVTKPVVLIIIPILFIAFFFSNKKFKFITIISIIMGIVQFILLYWNNKLPNYAGLNPAEYTFQDKFISALSTFSKFISAQILGLDNKYNTIGLGLTILLILLIIIYKAYKKHNYAVLSLIGTGILLILFNSLFLCFSLSSYWTSSSQIFRILYRHTVGNNIGIIFILAGICEIINKKIKYCGIILFICWFIFSGFLKQGLYEIRPWEFPKIHCSKWQKNFTYNTKHNTACVPINPRGWLYFKNNDCQILDKFIALQEYNFIFEEYNNEKYDIDKLYEKELSDENLGYNTYITQNKLYENKLSDINLESILIYIKPINDKTNDIKAEIIIQFYDNSTVKYNTNEKIYYEGNAIQFYTPIGNKQIRKISFEFSEPVEILKCNNEPVITWLGRKN